MLCKFYAYLIINGEKIVTEKCQGLESLIANISAGRTTLSTCGKCFKFPVTKYESSLERATS